MPPFFIPFGDGDLESTHLPAPPGISWRERRCICMDPETEREIWRRVQQTDRLNAEEILLPEKLEQAIQDQRTLTALLIRTARRLPNGDRSALLRIAADTRSGTEELSTLHYLLTGRQLRLRPRPLPPQKPVREELRDLYHRFRSAAGEAGAIAGQFSDYADRLRERERQLTLAARGISTVLKGKLR